MKIIKNETKAILLFTAMLCSVQYSHAQVAGTPYIPPADIPFSFLYGGSNSDISSPMGMDKTADGGSILVGTSSSSISGDITGINHGASDFWIVKLDRYGKIEWQRLYGGSGRDEAYSIQQTTDGGYIVAGFSMSSASGDVTGINHGQEPDAWVFKLNASGDIQWQRLYGGDQYERFDSIRETSDGGYIAAGYSTSSANGDVTGTNIAFQDTWIVKLNSSGNIQWQQLYSNIAYGSDSAGSIEQTSDGGYIISGLAAGGVNGIDYRILKLNSAGTVEWDKLYGGSGSDYINYTMQTADGGYIVTGYSNSSASGNVTGTSHGEEDIWVIKLNSLGNIQWQRLYGGTGYDRFSYILQTNDGGYLLGASSNSSASGDVTGTSNGGNDIWTVKLNSVGNIEWQKLYGGNGSDVASSIKQAVDGSYIIAGLSRSSLSGDVTDSNNGSNDCWVMKLDSSGNIMMVPSLGQ